MRITLQLFCLFLSLTFLSCSDSEEETIVPQPENPAPTEVSFPINLYVEKVLQETDVRLFTNGAEIKDKALAYRYIRPENRFFHLQNSAIDPDEIRMTLLSKDSARFGAGKVLFGYTFDKGKFLFTSKGDKYYNEIENIFRDINTYKGPKLPVYGGSLNSFAAQDVMPAYGGYDRIELPVFVYKVAKIWPPDAPFGAISSVRTHYNELDESFISTLDQDDTLAVQTFIMHLKRK